MRIFKMFGLAGVALFLAQSAAAQAALPDAQEEIGLQNLRDRTIVRCYGNNENSAEDCAKYFEQKGYVRFKDIPYKTANYDFLKVDTYPTRRWRDSETTPRW